MTNTLQAVREAREWFIRCATTMEEPPSCEEGFIAGYQKALLTTPQAAQDEVVERAEDWAMQTYHYEDDQLVFVAGVKWCLEQATLTPHSHPAPLSHATPAPEAYGVEFNGVWFSYVEEVSKHDDWHEKLVGSDIRMLCGLVRQNQEAIARATPPQPAPKKEEV